MTPLPSSLKVVIIGAICLYLLVPVAYCDAKLDEEDEENESDEDDAMLKISEATTKEETTMTTTINDSVIREKDSGKNAKNESSKDANDDEEEEEEEEELEEKGQDSTPEAEPKISSVVMRTNALPKGEDEESDSDEDDDEDDEDEDDDFEDSCDGKLSSFVRDMNTAPFLPDDYDSLTESMDLGYDEVEGNLFGRIKNINDTLFTIERLLKYAEKIMGNSDLAYTFKYLGSIISDKLYDAKISPQCTADLLRIGQGIRNNELWALKFPDSFGSLHITGLLSVQVSSFGEFQQCVSIKSPALNDRHVYGRYCQLQIESPFPPLENYNSKFEADFRSSPTFKRLQRLVKRLNLDNYLTDELQFVKFSMQLDRVFNRKYLNYGVCFPHTCTSTDIARLFNRFLYPITKVAFKVDPALCDEHEEIKTQIQLDGFQITAKYFFIILITLVILATSYEIYLFNNDELSGQQRNSENDSNNNDLKVPLRQQSVISTVSALSQPESVYTDRSIPMQIFLSFGAVRNSQILARIDNRYAPLDTARFLLTFVMSTINSFLFAIVVTPQLLRNMINTMPYEIFYQRAYWFARTPGLWCDGFIFTIGVTIVLQQFNFLNQTRGRFNYFLFLFKPWLHITVLMLGAIMVIYLLPLYDSGPFWHITEDVFAAACKKVDTIVPSFLMYNNWIGPISNYTVGVTCNPTTWFISMAAQLYFLTPIIFLSLYFCPGFGLALTTTLLFISPIFILSPRFFFNLPPYMELTKHSTLADFYRSFTFYQFSPFQYITSMCTGLLTGYLVKRKPNLQMPGGRKVAATLWWLNFLAVIGVFLWNCSFWEVNKVVSSHSVMTWLVVSKFVCLLWLAYSGYLCCTGRSKILNAIFTIRWMQPIAKLSYTIYLLRSITISKRFASPKRAYEIEYWQTFQNLIIDFWLTIFLAYVLYLLLEAPLVRISRILAAEYPRLLCTANFSLNYHQNLMVASMSNSKARSANKERDAIPEIMLK